jgi:hypothetical protein
MVAKYRGDPTGTTGLLQVWMQVGGVTTQIVNLSNIQLGTAPQGYPTDYLKSGLDNEETGGGANGVYELRYSVGIAADTGQTAAQMLAAMPA